MLKVIGWLYEHWGSLSQLIVGLLAFLLSILPSRVAELEKKAKYRIGLPFFVGVIAITGYVVSDSQDTKLKGQLATMFQQVTLEATKDDIFKLTTHIDEGFKNVADAIATLCKPSKTPQLLQKAEQQPPLTAPPNVRITQARAVSTNPEFKFALQVTIQSDQPIPASFAIECTGEVGNVNAFMVGQSAYMGIMFGVGNDPHIAIVRIQYPQLTPQSPLVVTILSKEDIRVKAVRPFQQ
jgi:hypothetical protein